MDCYNQGGVTIQVYGICTQISKPGHYKSKKVIKLKILLGVHNLHTFLLNEKNIIYVTGLKFLANTLCVSVRATTKEDARQPNGDIPVFSFVVYLLLSFISRS